MDKQSITTGATPTVVIEQVQGDLRLKGHADLEVTAKASAAEELFLEQRDEEIYIRSESDLSVRVPLEAHVRVQTVHGEATIKALDGQLEIDTVHGNLSLRGVGPAQVNIVHGELAARNIAGDFSISSVQGNSEVRDVQGNFNVSGLIHGNLRLDDVDGDVRAASDGNLTLRLDPAPGQTYELRSNGNIFCRLSEDSSVELCVPKANKVIVNLPGLQASAPIQTPYALTLGDGDSELTLNAEGNVIIDSHAPDWSMDDFDVEIDAEMDGMADAIGQQIEQQVEAQMRMMEEQLNAQMATLTSRMSATQMSDQQVRRIEERARQASERATSMAQERMRRAQERIELKLAAAQRKIEQKSRAAERRSRTGKFAHEGHAGHPSTGRRTSWGIPTPPPSPTPPTPPTDPVSEEERLMILRMLEQKKISMEEAETLLSALEGKEA